MPYAPAVGARTMKVRKVLMQAISGRLTWLQAEDILGWRPRTLRRWRQRYRLRGYDGLWDRRRQRPAPRCAPVAEVARIARLYRERSAGFNAAHFHEIAQRDHGVTFGYTFVKRLLQTAGLLPPRRPRGRHRRRREPRPCFGELLHIDGSPHAGLARRPTERQTLIPIINDAAKRVLYAQLVAAESTATGMAALWSVLVTPGLPQALYSDRASWAFYTPKAGAPVDRAQLTQVGRARAQLGVAHLPAYSPAARGRSERLHRTFQDRLVHELAAAGITTVPAANRYLHERFLATYDARFTHPPPIPPQPSCPSARWIPAGDPRAGSAGLRARRAADQLHLPLLPSAPRHRALRSIRPAGHRDGYLRARQSARHLEGPACGSDDGARGRRVMPTIVGEHLTKVFTQGGRR
jgi:transposase